MFCKYCGKEIEDGKEVCEECASKETKAESVNEQNVVENVTPVTESNTTSNSTNGTTSQGPTNTVNNTAGNTAPQQKSKIAAGLFGIFLGVFGVHNFYLGFTGKAVAQLLITILSCGLLSPVSAIWALIEGILILAGEITKDAYGNDLKE